MHFAHDMGVAHRSICSLCTHMTTTPMTSAGTMYKGVGKHRMCRNILRDISKMGTWNRVYFLTLFRGSNLRDEQDQKNLPKPSTFTTFFNCFCEASSISSIFSTIGANFQRIHVMKTRGWFIHFRGRQPNFIGFCWKVGYSKVFHCSTIHGSWGVPLGELEELIF